ncbi:hypothetical protein PV04_04018 [Phialophora macrospora]|uniref:GPI inositol-deacylase n=1 Tax=Phialophora macrospora TaxID=1851006 RepID=A0A0D2FJ31_9EURO|nr:hypothetical protein PV04_04018 [Phialophora macrospora]
MLPTLGLRKLFRSRTKWKESTEGVSMTKSTVEDFPCGFEQWYPESHSTPEPHDIDVIFVHGLTGNRNTTWTHRVEETPWPKSVLSSSIPSARLLTYGYDAYPARAGHRTGHSKLRDHAQNFVHEFAARRSETQTAAKPVLLIGHSMGGLMIKAALTFAAQSGQDSAEYLLVSCTIGILFMGTPHGGSWHADWSAIPVNIFRPFKDINMSLLKVLQSDDEYLKHLHESFLVLRENLRERGQKIAVWTMYEELPMRLPYLRITTMIVNPVSARFSEGHDISIRKDHSEMTKFRCQIEDPFGKQAALLTIVGTIKAIMRSNGLLAEAKALRQPHSLPQATGLLERQTMIDLLWFPSMFRRLAKIADPDPSTFTWLSGQHQWETWLASQQTRMMLLIKGPLGCGKSTLLRHVVKKYTGDVHLPDLANWPDLCLSFFFDPETVGLESSSRGLYRSILCQLVRKYPQINDLIRSFREDVHGGDLEPSELWNLLRRALSSDYLRGKYIMLVVDAVNECRDISPADLISKFGLLCDLAKAAGIRLAICASCREHPIIEFSSWLTILMVPINDADLHAISERRLHEFLSDAALTANLERLLVKKACGNILWLTTAITQLREQYFAGTSSEYLPRALDNFNHGLEELYSQSMAKLSPEQRRLGSIIASWLQVAKRSLTIQELVFGVGLSIIRGEGSLRSVEQAIGASMNDVNALLKFVTHNTAGLLRPKQRKRGFMVEFSHESARSYFMDSKRGLKILDAENTQDFRSKSHNCVALAFHTYSSMSEIQMSYSGLIDPNGRVDFKTYTTSSSAAELRGVSRPILPLARYFAHHAFDHIKEASWYSPSQAHHGLIMQTALKGWVFSICTVTDHFEATGVYDDAFWHCQAGLGFVALHASTMGLDAERLNELVSCINNRNIFLRNMAKDRQEGSHIWAGHGDEYFQIYYLSSRQSKSVELSDMVGSKLRENGRAQSAVVGDNLKHELGMELSSYLQICSSYAAGVAFVAVFQCSTGVAVSEFKVENSAPIKEWREQKPEAPQMIPTLTTWDLVMDNAGVQTILSVGQGDEIRPTLIPFHSRADRGFISLLFFRDSGPSSVFCALEVGCQDEHNCWSDPDNSSLLFIPTDNPSLISQRANAGMGIHVRLFLISDDKDSEVPATREAESSRTEPDHVDQGDDQSKQRPGTPSSSESDEPEESWKQELRKFETSKKTEVDGILPDDDHLSFAGRHEQDLYSLRRRSIESIASSLQGLDLEYERLRNDDGASVRSVTGWLQNTGSLDIELGETNAAVGRVHRVLIDGKTMFTRRTVEISDVSDMASALEHEHPG